MFSPEKANLEIGEITAAGIMKRIRRTPQGRVPPDPAKATPAWKIWVAVLGFLALLAVVAILAA